MQNSEDNITPANNSNNQLNENEVVTTDQKVIETGVGAKDGQNKCPKCGSTDISLNVNTGKLRCNFCRHEFEPIKVNNMEQDIDKLKGEVIGSGATDIVQNANDVMTLKCSSCGAEVVIDTASATQARCHWCRSTLSINQQIPNGAVPDVVLPFGITKDIAKKEIEKFVGKRKFFAHPKFRQEFTTDNIMGVYFPYMLVDINSHANLVGQGEHLIRRYSGGNNNSETFYDAELYNVEREFDIAIEGLSIEASADKLNKTASDKTNNVINAIMPFDLENCVQYDSNYLKGYTSEKRDVNIDTLKPLVEGQAKDVVRFAANNTLTEYDRGVAWSNEQLNIYGEQWKAAYLPVWLYSYQQVKGDKKILHYVAVNARTKETMGSVPIHYPKLIFVSFIVELLGFIAMINIDFEYNWLFLLLGFIYFFIMFLRYRNSDARHQYETETKSKMANLRKVDRYVETRKGLRNAHMQGANNTQVGGQGLASQLLNTLVDQNPVTSFINDNTKNKGGS